MIKRIIGAAIVGALTVTGLTACKQDAQQASDNLSTAADNFEVYRRVVFYNAIKGENVMVIEGWCSVDFTDPNKESVICRVGGTKDKPEVVRNGMSRSDNVFCTYTQLNPVGVSANHYRLVLKPEQIIPDIEFN